ncbi:MAG: hypothetical protein ACYCY2_01005 [Acidithiobacillus ferriphilus]
MILNEAFKIKKKIVFIIFTVATVALSGCIHPHINPPETQDQMAADAHATCLEYGAQPGTRMFYRCMKSQMRKEQYNESTSNCTAFGGAEQRSIALQCDQDISVGSSDYFQQIANCKANLTRQCEQQASNEYLHRNNAQKYDLNIHDYNHNN